MAVAMSTQLFCSATGIFAPDGDAGVGDIYLVNAAGTAYPQPE
jgi:hypothetical protein